jgi:phage gp36-like protein
MYATVEQLNRYLHDTYDELYYVEDGDDTTSTELATDDLEAASAEIDGALGCRYAVPVSRSTVLPMLRTWCLALTAELAWGRSAMAEPPKNLVERCSAIRKRLAEYAEGTQSLAADPIENPTDGAASAALVQGDTPIMTKTKLAGW